MQFVKKGIMVLISIGLIFFAVPNLYADDTSELILKLLVKKGIITQEEVDGLKTEVAKTKKEEPKTHEERLVKLEKDAPLHVKIGQADAKLYGYIQIRYTDYEDRDTYDSFTIPNAKLGIVGNVVPEIAYKLEIGAHQTTGILYDAWMRLDYLEYAHVTIGQFKTGLGYEYLTSSSMLDTINRSAVITNLTSEYDLGVMIDADLFNKAAYYAFEILDGMGTRNPTSFKKTPDLIGRAIFRPFTWMKNADKYGNLDLGAGYQIGYQNSTNVLDGWRHRVAFLGKYVFDKFKLQSEYIYQYSQRLAPTKDLESQGFYVLTTYNIPFKLYSYDMSLEPVFKVDMYDADMNRGKDLTWTFTPGVNWHFNKYFKIMFNYQVDVDTPTNSADNQFLFQTQVKF